MNAFIKPVFRYCNDVWHFCSARSRDKLESLDNQILKVVLNDFSSSYEDLLTKPKNDHPGGRLDAKHNIDIVQVFTWIGPTLP